jgi:hypothetical protein
LFTSFSRLIFQSILRLHIRWWRCYHISLFEDQFGTAQTAAVCHSLQ